MSIDGAPPVAGRLAGPADGAVRVARPAGAPEARLRTAVAGSVVGKGAEMVTLALLATVVPRALGPTAYGRFAVALTIVTLGSLALTLGGPTLMARYVPAAAPEDRVATARAIGARLARGRAVQLAAMGAVAAVVVAAAPDRVPPLATTLVAVALVLNVAASLLLQVALGLGHTGAWSARYPVQNAVLIASVLVLYPAAGDIGAVAANAVAGAVAAAFALVVFRRVAPRGHARVPVPQGALRFGALQATGAALTQVTQRGGVLAVALLAGSTVETGYAALATGIALGATYAVLQAFTVSLPHLSAHDAGPDDADGSAPGTSPSSVADATRGGHPIPRVAARSEGLLRRMAWWLLAVLIPALAVAGVLLPHTVPVAFGDEFRGAAPTFAPALALVALAPLAALYVQASALRLRPGASAASGAAAAAAFVLTAAIAVPAWGGPGGTAAGLAATAVGVLVSTVLLPGAAGGRVLAASAGGATLVLVVAVAAT